MNDARTITVDGPAGSGKSTLGRALARRLALPLIDTGLFYRGIMVAAARAGLGMSDTEALGRLAETTVIGIPTDPWSDDDTVLVDGTPAGPALRDPRNAPLLVAIASAPAVRAAVLEPQRALAADGAVAVGRDCGTVVFPDAAVKFYLDAPEAVRERRRLAQLRARGAHADDDTLRAEVGGRDRIDTARSASPLRPAVGAHVIDTGTMDRGAMIDHAMEICSRAGLGAAGPH